jgi:predicted DNA-binding transcriptional regulator AlpA
VYEAFENRWDLAARYYRKERIPETAAQRSQRRRMAGRSSGERESPLAGVRLFLEQDPPPETTRTNYETWAAEFNQKPPPGYGNGIETGPHISGTLGLGWEEVIEVAAGRKPLDQAQVEALSQALSEPGPLVGHQLASRMLGRSPDGRHAKKPGYPPPVVRLGKSWLWLRSDIEGWKAGRRDFTHERGVLQDRYLNADELAERLGISAPSLRERVYAELWDRAPRPAGRAGKSLYWDITEVERWFREAPRHIGPLRGRPRKAVS